MDTTPQQDAPQVTSITSHRIQVLLILLIIAVTVAGCLMAYVYIPYVRTVVYSARAYVINMGAPAELRQGIFVAYTDTTTQLYTRALGYRFEQRDEIQGHLVSQDIHGAINSRIIQMNPGLYEVRINDAVVASSSRPVLGVSVSDDGRYVTYAEAKAGGVVQLPPLSLWSFFTLATRDWSVVLLDTQTHTRVELGVGVSPCLVDNTHIMYTNVDGVYVYDIATGARSRIVDRQIPHVSALRMVSLDRTTFGVRGDDGRSIDIYAYQSATQPAHKVVSMTVSLRGSSYVLGTNHLYSQRIQAQKAQVRGQKFNADASTDIMMVPDAVQPAFFSLGIF